MPLIVQRFLQVCRWILVNKIRELLFTNFCFPEIPRGIERKILCRMMHSTQNALTLTSNLFLYTDNFLSMLIPINLNDFYMPQEKEVPAGNNIETGLIVSGCLLFLLTLITTTNF
ncbi:hypothetical protein EUS16_19210 [Salmonella enterica subsp. enterica serovar Augustenborg]|nr:hypothetical protein [Salmonella enterica subsp. enterica serovar Virchow]EBS3953429.1 hypothetical protein [Salmonella enterica subsp. enterica serovar Augustenborg]ECH9901172.1 hypothetical protein [Salmonella enterica subsp. enterica]EBU9171597.1 hypothetical protein [Salmonella enterica subsp. enterica serovar Augustenborg]EBV2311690.1 hypothetical protein [Salmonella enterica subsp. enterica serovar Augustenborg]